MIPCEEERREDATDFHGTTTGPREARTSMLFGKGRLPSMAWSKRENARSFREQAEIGEDRRKRRDTSSCRNLPRSGLSRGPGPVSTGDARSWQHPGGSRRYCGHRRVLQRLPPGGCRCGVLRISPSKPIKSRTSMY